MRDHCAKIFHEKSKVISPKENQTCLQIEVVFDFSCPWSRIGIDNLFTVLNHRSEISCSVIWTGVFLGEQTHCKASTMHANRLLSWLSSRGNVAPLVSAIFKAHSDRQENIGDIAVLTDIAGQCGFDREAVQGFLSGNLLKGTVVTARSALRHRGFQSVPTIVIDGIALSGLQEPYVYERLLNTALSIRHQF